MPFRFSRRRAWTLMIAAGTLVPGVAIAGPDRESDGPTFDLSGSVRVEAETIGGQFRPGYPASDTLFSSRTLVLAKAEWGPVKLVGEIDDARGYGERHGSSTGTGEVNALEPIQAYLGINVGAIGGIKGRGDLALGRFVLDIGSGRLVGRPDSANSPTTYLGARFDWKSQGGDRIVAFWARPFDKLPTDAAGVRDNKVQHDRQSSGLVFWGGSLTKADLGGKIGVELYGYRLAENDTPIRASKDRHLVTFGGRLFRPAAKGKLDFEIEAIGQRGHTRATSAAADHTDLSVRAASIHGEAGLSLDAGWAPRVVALADYASGDGPAASYGRFDPLFASRRGDFGPTGLYGPLSRANFVSGGLGLEGKPAKGWDFFVKGRLLWLASATDSFAATGVRDKTGASGSSAGAQIELRARKWLVDKKLRFEFGGARLFKGHFLETAPNAPNTGDTNYGYTTLTAFF